MEMRLKTVEANAAALEAACVRTVQRAGERFHESRAAPAK